MEFRFIDNKTRLDRGTQRLIRSHAMKGKNLGKVVPARGHKHQQGEQAIIIHRSQTEEDDGSLGPEAFSSVTSVAKPEAMPPPLNPFCGAEFSFIAFPIEVTPSIRYLLNEFHHTVREELYSSVFCHKTKEAEPFWFQYIIINSCVAHCILALTADYQYMYKGQSDEKETSTWHLSQAMSLLSRDLGSSAEPGYSSIAVVISLAIHAKLKGSTDESRIHLLGLKRILELRPGGFAALRAHTTELGNKIRRADAEVALLAGTATVFGSQPLPATAYVVPPLDDPQTCGILPYPLSEACTTLQWAMRDVLVLCSYAGRAQLETFQYQDMITSIFQRLVDYAPLSSTRPPRPIDDICQLGLIAFMTTILYRARQRRSIYTMSLSGLLWARLSDGFDNNNAHTQDHHPPLRLWLIFIYALSAPEYERCFDATSDVSRDIRSVAEVLNVKSWEHARSYLITYPWVAAFHDEPGMMLWESAKTGMKRPA